MKNFIKLIKDKDQKITASYTNKKLKNLEHIMEQLEVQHQQIKEDITNVDYLLDLIDKHQVEVVSIANKNQHKIDFKKWLTDLTSTFEKLHLIHTNILSSEDIEYLKVEKSKLIVEKKRLEEEHVHIHILIAKTTVFLMDTRETICKELSNGHSIAGVGEKLLEHFGKKIENVIDYDSGRRKIIRFLESTFSINKIQSKKLFDILEKSKAVHYITDLPNIIMNADTVNFDYYINYSYVPLVGTWYINS